MATKKKVPEEGTITTTIDDEAVEKLKGLFTIPDVSTITASDSTSKTLTVDPGGYYTWTTTTPSPWDSTYVSVSPSISATPRDAASEGATPYADGFLPHLVRAKEEGIRKGIEMDTVIIDRGVAVSIGLDPEKSHVDMILGLKVKYAKEKSLPMDSAFVLLKEKKKEKPAKTKKADPAPTGPGGVGYGAAIDVSPEEEEAWVEKERTSPVSGTTGKEILGSRHDATSSYGKRFISFPYDKHKKPILLSVDKIVCVEDKYVDGDPSLGWLGLEIIFEIAGKERVIIIKDKEVAKHVWDDLRTTMVYHMK